MAFSQIATKGHRRSPGIRYLIAYGLYAIFDGAAYVNSLRDMKRISVLIIDIILDQQKRLSFFYLKEGGFLVSSTADLKRTVPAAGRNAMSAEHFIEGSVKIFTCKEKVFGGEQNCFNADRNILDSSYPANRDQLAAVLAEKLLICMSR